MTRSIALFLTLGTLSLAGCGADATVALPGDGGSALDSGQTGDGGGNGDGGTTTATKGGGVYLTSYAYTVANTPVAGMSVSAGFYSSFGPATGSCTTTTDGPCTVSACAIGGADAGAGPVAASAGTVQVTGGSQPVQLVPSGTTYTAVTGQTTLWNGGEQLDVLASGAEAPAFQLKVVAPGYVTVTVPAWPAAGGKVPIVRTQPFALAWTGGGAGNVLVGLSGTSTTQSTSLSCSFPAGSGAGSVPASALAKLPASPTSAAISISASNTTESVVSGWSYRVTALSLAKTSAGLASAQVTLQ